MRISVSAINLFNRCPQEWYNRYVLGRERESNSIALKLGTIYHLGMEAYLRARKTVYNHREALEIARQAILDELTGFDNLLDSAIKEMSERFQHLPEPFWYDPKGIVAIEERLEIVTPVAGIRLVGRPDAVYLERPTGKYYHIQHKSVHLSTSIPGFVKTRANAPHELMYAMLIMNRYRVGREKYGGTILNIMKKGGIPGPQKFFEELVPINWEEYDRFHKDTAETVEEMRQIILLQKEVTRRNRDACYRNNSVCPYFDVCTDKAKLNQHPYQDALDSYGGSNE